LHFLHHFTQYRKPLLPFCLLPFSFFLGSCPLSSRPRRDLFPQRRKHFFLLPFSLALVPCPPVPGEISSPNAASTFFFCLFPCLLSPVLPSPTRSLPPTPEALFSFAFFLGSCPLSSRTLSYRRRRNLFQRSWKYFFLLPFALALVP